jgi:hypothetical protein
MTDENKAGNSADNLDSELASLPEKYKGKTVADVVRMHQEAEVAMSRQGQELGEYRRLAHTLAETATRPEKREEKRPEVTTDDLFADPAKAIDDVIESHPAVKRAREQSENLERQLAIKDFEAKHPSYREDATDAEFLNWIAKNPALSRLASRADAYDFDAADQLFGLWNEKKSLKQNIDTAAKEIVERQKKERDGTLESNSGADASSEVVLSRAEIRNLHQRALMGDKAAKAKWEDPKFRAARLKAYASGRVS